MATLSSLVVLVGLFAAGYVLVSGAHADARPSYWCFRALDRADTLDSLARDISGAQTAAAKARRQHKVAKYHQRAATLRNLQARSAHERAAYRSEAARCRDAR